MIKIKTLQKLSDELIKTLDIIFKDKTIISGHNSIDAQISGDKKLELLINGNKFTFGKSLSEDVSIMKELGTKYITPIAVSLGFLKDGLSGGNKFCDKDYKKLLVDIEEIKKFEDASRGYLNGL